MVVKIRQKAAPSFVLRMADVVPNHGAFAGDLAYLRHLTNPEEKEARLYQSVWPSATWITQKAKVFQVAVPGIKPRLANDMVAPLATMM